MKNKDYIIINNGQSLSQTKIKYALRELNLKAMSIVRRALYIMKTIKICEDCGIAFSIYSCCVDRYTRCPKCSKEFMDKLHFIKIKL
jgi:predicted Zn-ribbon and HTH transcriptional regulator